MKNNIFKIWISAARPKTLPAGIAPVLIGTAMAYVDGFFHFGIFAAIVFAVLMIQIGTNYANDYYDFLKGADTDKRTGPVRATQAGLVSANAMRNAFVIAIGFALLAGLYLVYKGGIPIMMIGLVSIICGILYTAGPMALGYLGLGDMFVLAFFGPVAVGGTYYLLADQIQWPVLLAGLSPGLISTALLTINNIRDYDTDKLAGKKTLAVRFGIKFGITEYYLCLITACLIPVALSVMTQSHYYCSLALLTLAFAFIPMKKLLQKPDAETLNILLAQTGRLVLIHSILFSVGWML
ncbi:MAG: 1,4-dihydroxy-2-naphthoate polyprenyltransferase [Planctomycetota bacterium]|jgi:1,4-dihydroxy-2-naphthoate octaprenyltransferase